MERNDGVRILCIGLPPNVIAFLKDVLTNPYLHSVDTAEAWEELFATENHNYAAVICGPDTFGMQSIEVAQSCASFLPDVPVYFVAYMPKDFTVRELLKNGFHQAFLLPEDQNLLRECMALTERRATGKGKVVQRAVSLIDLEAGEPLDFEISIFLRLNKKYVRIVNEGKALDQARLEKFKSYQVDRVYIDASKIDRFYKYSAEKLRKMNAPQAGVSETERLEKIQKSLRKIIHTVFDSSADSGFEQGRQIFEDTAKVISDMIGTGAAHNLQLDLAKAMQQSPETSSRASRVSTLAAIFEMALGLRLTQQAAIAGLFLDIGLAQLPLEIQNKKIELLSPEELKEYYNHPFLSVSIMQSKRMAIPPEVKTAILQHHEKFDGTGFPNQTPGHKIPLLSQVVSAADQIEQLVFSQESPIPFDEAVEKLRVARVCSPEVTQALQKLIAPRSKAA